jgi:hypothetical protein
MNTNTNAARLGVGLGVGVGVGNRPLFDLAAVAAVAVAGGTEGGDGGDTRDPGGVELIARHATLKAPCAFTSGRGFYLGRS